MRGIAISQALIQDDRLVGPVVATCKAMVRHHMMSQTREVRAAGKPRRASKT
jgi:hypothetical protein